MEMELITSGNKKIARVTGDFKITELQDAVDLLGNANYRGAGSLILEERSLPPRFFDLKTGMAGEILQKYSNYQMKLAIIGDFDNIESKALNAFIIECNRGNQIFFVPDYETAVSRLT